MLADIFAQLLLDPRLRPVQSSMYQHMIVAAVHLILITQDDHDEAALWSIVRSYYPGSDAEEEPAEEPAKDGATYTGTWKTPWGPVKLVQTGKQLSGSYTGSFTGTLEGTVEDGVADVGWTQTNGEHGRARFTIAADGESFKGTWGSNASATNGGPWNGERKKGGGGLL